MITSLVDVSKGQDPYSVIGNYIRNHTTAIEDMIAVIQINEVIMNELYMVDMDADGYFYWKSDWWEGEENVALLDYFPVSEAERRGWIPCSEQLPEKSEDVLLQFSDCMGVGFYDDGWGVNTGDGIFSEVGKDEGKPIAWMPLPEPYKEGADDEPDK